MPDFSTAGLDFWAPRACLSMPAFAEPMLLGEDTTCMNNMTNVWAGSEGWKNFPGDEAKAGRSPTSIQLLETQHIHVAVSGA